MSVGVYVRMSKIIRTLIKVGARTYVRTRRTRFVEPCIGTALVKI